MNEGIVLAGIFIVGFSLIVTPICYFGAKWLSGNKRVVNWLDKAFFGQ